MSNRESDEPNNDEQNAEDSGSARQPATERKPAVERQPAVDKDPQMKANKPRRSVGSLIRIANVALDSDDGSGATGEDTPDDLECWLLRMNSVDYGPFDAETVREKLEAGEIDEHTIVIDNRTGSMSELIDSPKFVDYVLDYIPRRERAKIEEQERKEDLVREVKRRSIRATVAVALGSVVLGFIGLLALHTTGVLRFQDIGETLNPSPVEFPFSQTVRSYRYRFVVPEPEYQNVEVDNSLVASLFEQPSARRSRSGAGSRGGGTTLRTGDYEAGGNEEYVLNFDNDTPAFKLTGEQINSTLSSNVGRIQQCFQGEMRRNPRFQGINLTFSISPDGRTFNVRVSSTGPRSSALDTCVVRAIRSVRFPPFNDVPMSVSFPFYVQ